MSANGIVRHSRDNDHQNLRVRDGFQRAISSSDRRRIKTAVVPIPPEALDGQVISLQLKHQGSGERVAYLHVVAHGQKRPRRLIQALPGYTEPLGLWRITRYTPVRGPRAGKTLYHICALGPDVREQSYVSAHKDTGSLNPNHV